MKIKFYNYISYYNLKFNFNIIFLKNKKLSFKKIMGMGDW